MEKKTPLPRVMEGKRLWMYSGGIMGQLLPINFMNAYILVFFTYVIGLDALLVSIGTALGAITNAFCAPLFGYAADKKRPGKLGKRRPFMLLGLPIMTFSLMIIWFSPRTSFFGEQNVGIAMFFWIFQLAFFINLAMVRSAYISALPEQSQAETNRVKISTIQGLFSILGTMIGIVFPLILQSITNDPQSLYDTPEDVALLRMLLPVLGIIFAALTVVLTILAFISIDESFHKAEPDTTRVETRFKDAVANIFRPFSDGEYRKWLFASMTLNTAMRMIVKVLALFFTYVLLLKGGFIIFILLVLPFAFVGFAIWSKKAKTRGLKSTFCNSTLIGFAFMACTAIYTFIPLDPVSTLVIAFIIFAGVLFNIVTGYLLPNPIISALVDDAPEHVKKKYGAVLSGSYFGSYLFLLNVANALGDIIIGFILMGENAENPFFIALVFPVASITYLISAMIFRSSKLK